MCGIAFAYNLKGNPVNNNIMQMFDEQRSRGTEGFGLFDGQEKNMVHATKEDKILKWLVKYDSNLILFHHRFPTSTINVKRAAHPFSTKDYFGKTQYILVHNGQITNADELYKEHTETGIVYKSYLKDKTFNDSEALLWDVALLLEGKQKELKSAGSIAFVCLKMEGKKLTKMYFGRNYNPLIMSRTKDEFTLSSEGKGEVIIPHTLYTYNYKLNRLTHRKLDIPSYTYTFNGNIERYESKVNYSPTPNYETYYDNYNSEEFEDELELFEDSYRPERYKVKNLVRGYLATSKGFYEEAYWRAEGDYQDMLADDLEMGINRERVILLEAVLEDFEANPEYIDDKSISSDWRAAWTV